MLNIVMCGLSVIDHPNFRQFLHDKASKYTPPCRQTITNSYLPKLVGNAKSTLQNVLDSADYVLRKGSTTCLHNSE